MSEENVEIVRGVYEALARRDWDGVFREAHSDFVIETQMQGSYRGRDEAQAFIKDQIGAFETWTADPEEFFAEEDRVLVFVRSRAQPRGTTATIEIKIGHVWTIRSGAILSLATFPSRDDALEAAGMSD